MQARAGFTLIELLIAAAISMTVVGIAIQQLWEYFHLQALLMARTELREETQRAQERIGVKLRNAIMLEDVPDNRGYMALLPTDVDRCGYLCPLDTYEVIWWQVKKNPLHPEGKSLVEQSISLPAFRDEPAMDKLLKIFEQKVAPAKELAVTMDSLEIKVVPPKTFRTILTASRPLPRRPEPVRIGLTELIAPRSVPYADPSTPSFDEVVEKLVRHGDLVL
jgi:prepilin-type N-terminal cleavage/methylation domain-containing protein